MKRLSAALIAVFLLTAACSGSSSAPDPPPDATGGVTLPETTSVPLSYLIKQSQQKMVEDGLGQWLISCTGGYFTGIEWSGHAWTIDNQTFTTTSSDTWQVTFEHEGFDPINSTWTYGDTKVLNNDLGEIESASYLLDNSANDTVLEFSQDESLQLHQERSTSTNTSIKFDMGTKTTGTVGGDAQGAKLEVEVAASFGIQTDKTTAEAESKDVTTTRHLANNVEPKHATLAVIETSNINSATPFAINGVWLATFQFGFESRWADPGTSCGKALLDNHSRTHGAKSSGWLQVDFKGVDDWLDMVSGHNTDWPTFGPHVKYVDPNGIIRAHAYIDKPENRRIIVDGTQRRTYQDGARVKFSDVTGQNLDQVQRDHGVGGDNVITSSSPKLGAETAEAVDIWVDDDGVPSTCSPPRASRSTTPSVSATPTSPSQSREQGTIRDLRCRRGLLDRSPNAGEAGAAAVTSPWARELPTPSSVRIDPDFAIVGTMTGPA